VFTVEGDDYAVQYFPVGMQHIEAPPELMLAQMAYVGVDHAILQAGGSYGATNDYNAFAQNQYPRQFSGLIHIDEGIATSDGVIAELTRAADLGLRGLYYSVDGLARYGASGFDIDASLPFWTRVAELDLPVFIEVNSLPTRDARGYVANLRQLDRLLTRFTGTRWLLVMGPPAGYFSRDGHWDFPDPVDTVLRRENLSVEILFPISAGHIWEYPYHEAQELIHEFRDTYGAEKMIWGSDMPNVERFCTYTQSLDYIRYHCDFLTSTEKELILGGNAARFLGLTSDALTS
jgi:predicted TIM-barrel fold metal-dependent hydrolase